MPPKKADSKPSKSVDKKGDKKPSKSEDKKGSGSRELILVGKKGNDKNEDAEKSRVLLSSKTFERFRIARSL